MVQALDIAACEPLSVLPRMTGTGAPVTEQLRCPSMGRIRVVPRDSRPYLMIGAFSISTRKSVIYFGG